MARHERAEAEHVGDDLDLARAPGPGPDPDRRDAEAGGDRRRQLLGHELQDHGERAGLLDREGVVEEGPRLLPAAALHPDLAERVDRLGSEADVAHHRDPGPHQRLDDPGRPDAALDLDGLGAGLAQEAPGVRERVLRASRTRGTACRPTTSARRVPRTTAFVWWSISSIVTRTVVS